MSRAISAGQARDYYRQEFTNPKDNYFSEVGEVKGRWSGSLADEWELKDEVLSEQYERLIAGQDPHTGEQLVRAVTARETVNEFGKEMVTSEHRAGWDATISAPKSVSLAALVGDDERIRDAHRESVNEALKGFEEYLQARGGGDKPAITTGKMVAAQFEHTSSRPDRTNGYAALAVRAKLKGGKMRYVPMPPELAAELRRFMPRPADNNIRYIGVHNQDRVFPPKEGAKGERQRVEGSFDDLLERARIEDFRFHDLRHTFASWYMMNGGDLYELAKILGHSNIKMTERYVKLARQHIARTSNTARELWKLLEPICDKANVG